MNHRLLRSSALVLGLALLLGTMPALAAGDAGTASLGHPLTGQPAHLSRVNSVLVLYTTTINGSVFKALTQLGIGYDSINTADWTGIDFSPYTTVIAAMDGGQVLPASIQAVRDGVLASGKKLIFLGGTCYQPFAQGVKAFLVNNDINNYCWAISAPPGLAVVQPSSPLVNGLPMLWNWNNPSAGFYQIRVTDPAANKPVMNGDHQPIFLAKAFAGQKFVWFTNSVFDSYWTNAGDFSVLKQIIDNALTI